jgi:hypothetical protein
MGWSTSLARGNPFQSSFVLACPAIWRTDNSQVVLADQRQMSALLTGLDVALFVMNRLQVYVEYLHKLPSGQPQANFEACLAPLHADCLQFFARAIMMYQKNVGIRTLEAIWKPSDVEDFEQTCRKRAEDVEIEAQSCDRALSELRHESSHQWFRCLQQELTSLDDVMKSVKQLELHVSAIWSQLEEDKRSEILFFTSTVAYEDNHRVATAEHVKGTSDWIFQRNEYKQWDQKSSSEIFWLHGSGQQAIECIA